MATQRPESVRDLARRCTTLEQQGVALQASNASLARLSSEVAHDLRGPLQVITGFVQLLARHEGARLDETSQGYLAHVLVAVGQMRGMLDSGVRMTTETMTVHDPRLVDLGKVLSHATVQIQSALDDAHAQLTWDPLPCVIGDPAALSRLFIHLIVNALTYSERPVHIHVGARQVEAAQEISVTDNGIGVPTERRLHLFDPFESQSGTGTDRKGVGLAICRLIVERHGGHIWMEDAPDHGSTFAFHLPDWPDPAERASAPLQSRTSGRTAEPGTIS